MFNISALILGIVFSIIGMIFAAHQYAQFPFLEEYVVLRENRSGVGLFGMLMFGVGFAVILSQWFGEKFDSANIAGISFGGTLVAVYVFMLIARATVFDDDSGMRYSNLQLEIQCPVNVENEGAIKEHSLAHLYLSEPERAIRVKQSNRPELLLTEYELATSFNHIRLNDALTNLILRPEYEGAGSISFVFPNVLPLSSPSLMRIFTTPRTEDVLSGEIPEQQTIMTAQFDTSQQPNLHAAISFAGVKNACAL